MEKLYKEVDNLSIDSLVQLRDYINNLIFEKSTKDSWNSKVEIKELQLDPELKMRLDSLGITNMAEYINAVENGLSFTGALKEQSDFALRMYDFRTLQKKYESRNK